MSGDVDFINVGGTCSIHYLPLLCLACTSYVPADPIYPSYAPPYAATAGTSILPIPPAFGYRYVPSVCDHCFCEWYDGEHKECCNCGIHKLEDKIPE